ncbi:hypothetical protein PLICRDRAFT_484067 [Plicaturopsis crispa FD-325 SS-3]|nr:hypothetical protein PLICRDRAFT_484067 [Plicaturopsis crispa FD-325 SS-3]
MRVEERTSSHLQSRTYLCYTALMSSTSFIGRSYDPQHYRKVCNYCMKEVGRQNLKECGGCHFVKYCSKDCQKLGWKTHKQRCGTGKALREKLATNPDANSLNEALSKWLDHWRGVLYDWSLWAMDLGNNSPDRLANNWFAIQIERRPDPPSKQTHFQMVGGEIMSWERFEQLLTSDLHCDGEHVEERMKDRRGNDTVQIVVVCEGMNKPFGHIMALDWEQKLTEIIESGKPKITRDYEIAAALAVARMSKE